LLAGAFWPGPLTLILKRAAHVLDAVTGGEDTVGVRVPVHPMARALLAELGGIALAAPSANRFGRVSPTRADHVAADLGGDVDLILDGGPCELGIESTIVDMSGETPAILRPGRILAAEIERVLGRALAAPAAQAPRAPGTLQVHYAPRARVQFATRRQIIDTLVTNKSRRIAVLAIEVSVPRLAARLAAVVPAIPAEYARSLYANLRSLDATGADIILVETPPDNPKWADVLDRLRRAAAR
jgi:L-threonylcarbamoyladenylate synthase